MDKGVPWPHTGHKKCELVTRHSVLLLLTCISGCSTFTLTAALRWSWAGVAVCPVMGWVLRCSAAAMLCNKFSCFTSSGATPDHTAHNDNLQHLHDNNMSNFISWNGHQIINGNSAHSISKDFVFRCVYGSLPDWVLTSVNIIHELLQICWNRMSLQLLDLHELDCIVEAVCTR